MRQEDAVAAVPRRALLAAAAVLLSALLMPSRSIRAEDTEPRTVRALLRALRSPIASVRQEAERDVVARGESARATVRAWSGDADPRLRGAAWRILSRIGTEDDLAAALKALADEQPAVAGAAAGAVLDLATTCPPPDTPPIPKGSLSASAIRNLALPLAHRLDAARFDEPPPCVFALGEGLVPSLRMICRHPRFSLAERRRAMDALARIGGNEARRAVAALALGPAPSDGSRQQHAVARVRALPSGWWSAINELGCGPGLADAHALVVEIARDTVARSRSPWIRGIGWNDQREYYRFVAACPPAEGIEHVRELLEDLLAWVSNGRPMFPSAMVEIARAHLVVSEPSDEILGDLIHATVPHSRRRRRVEELGAILALVATFKERPGVKAAAAEIIDTKWEDLPATVQAWALYLRGETPVAELRERATALIRGDGGAATVAQRRLGARLWQREELGLPPVALIRELLADLDPWMRATALGWAMRASDQGAMPAPEVTEGLTKGLRDQDNGVLLYVAGSRRVPVSKSVRGRILELAVRGPRGLRDRAWRVLDRLAAAEHDSAEPGFSRPRPGAALDERIRAAAVFRRRVN